MLRTWPCSQIGATLPNQFKREGWSHSVYLGQIDAENAKKSSAYIERGRVYLFSLCAYPGQSAEVVILIGCQCIQHCFEIAIALQHLCLIKIVEVQRLRQRENMFSSIVPI